MILFISGKEENNEKQKSVKKKSYNSHFGTVGIDSGTCGGDACIRC